MKKNHLTNPAWRNVLAAALAVLVLCGAPSLLFGENDVTELKLGENGIPEGSMIVDGDILVRGGTAATAPFPTELWPDGNPTIVPFMFDATTGGCACVTACTCGACVATDANPCGTSTFLCGAVIEAATCPGTGICNQTAMLNAMAIWEAAADVDFRPRAGEDDFIFIRNSSNDCNPSNSSFVGMIGGLQVLNISAWGNQATILHELGHALGFWHEQQRSDRNSFIQINCQNHNQGCCNIPIPGTPCDSVNFGFVNLGEYGPYDLGSIMHYGQCSSSACAACPNTPAATCPEGGRTITVPAPNTAQWQNAIGTATAPSTWDALVMSFLYPESNWRFLDNRCGNRGWPCIFADECTVQLASSFACPLVDNFVLAVDETPIGGTLWILGSDSYSTGGILSKPMTIGAPLGATLTP